MTAPAALATPSSHEVCACVPHVYVYSGIIVYFMDECALQVVCLVVIDFSWFGAGGGLLATVMCAECTHASQLVVFACEVYGYDLAMLPRDVRTCTCSDAAGGTHMMVSYVRCAAFSGRARST